MGGGIAAVATQTAVQGVVAHQDVAGVTAVYLLLFVNFSKHVSLLKYLNRCFLVPKSEGRLALRLLELFGVRPPISLSIDGS